MVLSLLRLFFFLPLPLMVLMVLRCAAAAAAVAVVAHCDDCDDVYDDGDDDEDDHHDDDDGAEDGDDVSGGPAVGGAGLVAFRAQAMQQEVAESSKPKRIPYIPRPCTLQLKALDNETHGAGAGLNEPIIPPSLNSAHPNSRLLPAQTPKTCSDLAPEP